MFLVTSETDGAETVINGRVESVARITGGELEENVCETPLFRFTIYPGNPGYDAIEPMRTRITVCDTAVGEDIFSGRVYSVSDVMTADGLIYKTAECEGELAYLCDVVISSVSFTATGRLSSAIASVLDIYNSKCSPDRRITHTFEHDAGVAEDYAAQWVTAFEVIRMLCEHAGQEFRITYVNGTRQLETAEQFGKLSGTALQLSVNLRELQRTDEPQGLITRLYPLGAKMSNGNRLTIAPAAAGMTYIGNSALEQRYGVIEGVKIYDDIALDEDSDTLWTASQRLLTRARREYAGMTAQLVSYELSVLDLSLIDGGYRPLRLYDRHRVVTRLQGIDDTLRIVGRKLLLDEPQRPQLTFGTKRQTLTGMLAGK